MRKDYWLLLILLLLILCGCGQAKSVSAYVSPVDVYNGEGEHVQEEAVLLKTYAEYQDFLNRMVTEAVCTDVFIATLSSYDESYFEQNMLAFIYFTEMTGSYDVILKNVEYAGSVVRVELQKWVEGTVADHLVSSYGAIVELPANRRSETVEFAVEEQKPEATRPWRDDNVKVAGVGQVEGLSYAEIAEKLNKAGDDQVTMKIVLNDSYRVEYHPRSELTQEEARALIQQDRAQVEEHYSTTNREILDSLDMSGFAVPFQVDSHMPWVSAEFVSGITEKDVEMIHELARDRKVEMIFLIPEGAVMADDAPWIPVVIGCAAAVIAAGAVFCIVRRRKGKNAVA